MHTERDIQSHQMLDLFAHTTHTTTASAIPVSVPLEEPPHLTADYEQETVDNA